uniref:Dynamin GTPase n=1 Tax=Ditylenchus dipsaci TaxID=166011 RepID=A0A915D1R5_9BILA
MFHLMDLSEAAVEVFKKLVRQEIEDETERLTGANKGISPIPINLKIYSHKVVNLSLVDLPGITKVPVGDQPLDIETQIRRMICSYIANPNSLILAVTPANQDFATSEPLKLARDVDKEGDRTLAVLTKLDLMDYGTDALDVLTGKLVPVKLGIIGVVNRSQADIKSKKSIEECLKDEIKFLHKKYPTLASTNGIQHLSKTLNRLLMHHIRQCLPQLKLRINTMTLQCQSLLNSYGEPVTDKSRTLLQIITHFANAYTSTIEGTSKNIDTSELSGGARICYIFYETFGAALEKVDPLDCLSQAEVLTAIRNATGPRPALFVSELCGPSLRGIASYSPTLRLRDTARNATLPLLYDRINEVVSGVLVSRLCPTKEFVSDLVSVELAYINSRHPEFTDAHLASILRDASTFPYDKQQQQQNALGGSGCTEYGEEVEAAGSIYNNSNLPPMPMDQGHAQRGRQSITLPMQRNTSRSRGFLPSFRREPDRMQNLVIDPAPNQETSANNSLKNGLPTKSVSSTSMWGIGGFFNRNANSSDSSAAFSISPKEKRDCLVIERLIRSYFMIVRKSIQDMVPKSIMRFLVNHVRDNLQSELVRQLYNSADIDELLSESELMAQRRKESAEMLVALNKATSVINEIRETHFCQTTAAVPGKVKSAAEDNTPESHSLVHTKYDINLVISARYIQQWSRHKIDPAIIELIEKVRSEPSLYNKAADKYFDNIHKARIWKKVAEETGLEDGKKAAKKWKYLREQYIRQTKKLQHPIGSRISEEVLKESAWIYFDYMTWLDADPSRDHNLCQDFDKTTFTEEFGLYLPMKTLITKKRKLNYANGFEEKLLDSIANISTEIRDSKHESADLLFGQAIGHKLAEMDAEKKARAKMLIQKVIYEVEFVHSANELRL